VTRLADPLTADDVRWLDERISALETTRDTATYEGYSSRYPDVDARVRAADELRVLRRIRAALPEVGT
jgi:hypothetical protein